MSEIEIGIGESVIALDVGGTDIKACLVDHTGRLLGVRRVETPESQASPLLLVEQVRALAKEFRSEFPQVEPAAVGLVVPGLIDQESGVGEWSENLGWQNVPFKSLIEGALGLPVAFGHDVAAAGDAEWALGEAEGYQAAAVVVVGTGIGAAIYLNGGLCRSSGYVGELGHTIVELDGPVCKCGRKGCLEAIASASAIARRYSKASGQMIGGAKDVADRAKANDPIAIEVWDSAVAALALGLAQLVAIVAPEVIVIGGGLADAGQPLFDPLEAELDRILTFHRRPKLVAARFGSNAGLVGSALAARYLLSSGQVSK